MNVFKFNFLKRIVLGSVIIKSNVAHISSILCAKFSHKDEYIISGDSKGKIVLWDASSVSFITEMIGHTGAILSLSISDEDKICSSGEEGSVRLWDLNGNCFKIIDIRLGYLFSLWNRKNNKDFLRCFHGNANQRPLLNTVNASFDDHCITSVQNVIFAVPRYNVSIFNNLYDDEPEYFISNVNNSNVCSEIHPSLGLMTIVDARFSNDCNFLCCLSTDVMGIFDLKKGKWSFVSGNLYNNYQMINGCKIIYSLDDSYILVRERSNGKEKIILFECVSNEMKLLSNIGDRFISVSFSPNSKFILTSSSGHCCVKVYEISSDTCISSISTKNPIEEAIFFNDNLRVAFYDSATDLEEENESSCYVWDRISNNIVEFSSGESMLYCIIVSQDCSFILSNGFTKIYMWQVIDGSRKQFNFQGVECLNLSSDDKIISFVQGMEIYLLDASTWTIFRTLSGHSSQINSLTFSPNSEILSSSSTDCLVMWQVKDGEKVSVKPNNGGSIRFSNNNNMFLSLLKTNEEIELFVCQKYKMSDEKPDVLIVSNNKLIPSQFQSRMQIRELMESDDFEIKSLAYLFKNGSSFITNSSNRETQIYNINFNDEGFASLSESFSHIYQPTKLAVSSKENYLCTASVEGTVHVWEIKKGKKKIVISSTSDRHSDVINTINFDPSHQFAVTSSDDCSAKVFEIESGRCLKTFYFKSKVNTAFLSPNHMYVIAYIGESTYMHSSTGGLFIQDFDSGATVLEVNRKAFNQIIFSSDGALAVPIGSGDRIIKIGDTSLIDVIIDLRYSKPKFIKWETNRNYDRAIFVQFSSVSSHLLIAKQDGRLELYHNLKECADLKSMNIIAIGQHRDILCAASFSYDEKFICSIDVSSKIAIWCLETFRCIHVFDIFSRIEEDIFDSGVVYCLSCKSEFRNFPFSFFCLKCNTPWEKNNQNRLIECRQCTFRSPYPEMAILNNEIKLDPVIFSVKHEHSLVLLHKSPYRAVCDICGKKFNSMPFLNYNCDICKFDSHPWCVIDIKCGGCDASMSDSLPKILNHDKYGVSYESQNIIWNLVWGKQSKNVFVSISPRRDYVYEPGERSLFDPNFSLDSIYKFNINPFDLADNIVLKPSIKTENHVFQFSISFDDKYGITLEFDDHIIYYLWDLSTGKLLKILNEDRDGNQVEDNHVDINGLKEKILWTVCENKKNNDYELKNVKLVNGKHVFDHDAFPLVSHNCLEFNYASFTAVLRDKIIQFKNNKIVATKDGRIIFMRLKLKTHDLNGKMIGIL